MSKNNHIIAFIPARGGSRGIPNKNIKEFAGKPLIVHSIEYALKSKLVNEVMVSTDDSKISKISKNAGVDILVSGTTIFKENSGNLKKNIQLLKTG